MNIKWSKFLLDNLIFIIRELSISRYSKKPQYLAAMKFLNLLAFGAMAALASAAALDQTNDGGYYTIGKRDDNGHLIYKRYCKLDGSDCPSGEKCICIAGPDPCSCG